MTNVQFLIIITLIYFISAYVIWKDVNKDYSKGGDYEYKYPTIFHFIACVTPILNTVFTALILFISIYSFIENNTYKIFLKFFNIKK